METVRRCLLICAVLGLPAVASAQEAVLTGKVSDTTGGVLPGVTVTVVNEATGNSFVAVTDAGGIYTIPVRVGVYRLVAELSGFSTVTRSGVQLLLGQTVKTDLQMSPGAVSETVTVTGETPLISTTTSALGGNIDPQQVAELPVSGRNFMALALLAPGSRTQTTDAVQPLPDRGRSDDVREFQINLDGQQVTRDLGFGNQPTYSHDMIAEFQYITNRFDASRGRSSGVLLNIISKSGTNSLQGLFRTNFRHSRLNAKQPVLDVVLPINNQQYSTAVGGPILKDKLHYFGNFEYEREPTTSIWNTRYPEFNVTLHGVIDRKKGGGRLDYQLTQNVRLMGKISRSTWFQPFLAGTTNHPAATNTNGEYNEEFYMRLTQVLGNRAVNEIEGGRAVYGFHQEPLTSWSNHWQKANGITIGSPAIVFQNFSISPNQNIPRRQDQWYWSIRDNFTLSYDARGRHDLKLGAEFLWRHQLQLNRRRSSGQIDARGGPTPGNLPALFPDPWNVDTWNLAALSPITRFYTIGIGNFNNNIYSQKLGAWAQDDWQMTDDLTLNLGLRWDVAIDAFANDVNFPPWQVPGKPNDWYNFQPRVGFAYKLGSRTVLRGGAGLYFADSIAGDESTATGNTIISVIRYTNNGRPDFAVDPTGGRGLPTYDEAQLLFCHNNNNAPGCLIQDAESVIAPHQYSHLGRAWQFSVGMQRQIGSTASFEIDYVFVKSSNEKGVVDNANLTYNPATGVNYPFATRALRAFPNWGVVSMSVHTGRSQLQELRFAFQKRFSNRWQARATYSLSGHWDAEPLPFSGIEQVSFPVSPDMGGEWGLSNSDQRHRAVFSGIWDVGKGFQVSALQYIGAGIRLETSYGGDLRGMGVTGTSRLRGPCVANPCPGEPGTIVPRNSLIAPWQNRTDVRLQQRIPVGSRLALDAIWEIFNAFNQPNWTIGTTENRATEYLQHIDGEYRRMQFGFRLTF